MRGVRSTLSTSCLPVYIPAPVYVIPWTVYVIPAPTHVIPA